MEEWKKIEEAPKYIVSSRGRVKDTLKGKLLKVSGRPYPMVHINQDGRITKKAVHVLVANAFVEGKEPGHVVKHLDENKENFMPDNLKWVPRSEIPTGPRPSKERIVNHDSFMEEI